MYKQSHVSIPPHGLVPPAPSCHDSRYTIGPEGNEGIFDGKVQLLDRHVFGTSAIIRDA